MKKTFLILTSLILVCIIFIGCQNTDATITTSKELNKNLTLLSNTVKRLDTVDNEYLINNELYTLNSSSQNNKEFLTKKTKLANSYNVIITNDTNNELNSILKEKVTNEIINRLYCTEDGNCKICDNKFICDDNGVCKSCEQTVICDDNGNCTNCGNTLVIDNNNCSSCNNNCTSKNKSLITNQETLNKLKQISSNNEKLNIEFLSTKNSNNDISDSYIDVIDNNIQEDNNNNTSDTSNNTLNNIDNPTNNSSSTNNNTSEDTSNNTIKYYYYSEESFNPEFLKYKPRFINNINHISANTNLENYVEKLQKLYTMTADVVEANNTLKNFKIVILDDISEAKELNECILSGNCTPNQNQINALSNYIDDIKMTIENLRNCNGNLTSEINKIANRNTGISNSIDVTNSNYLRILNQIDTRISYHENAKATLEQIKFLLQDAQSNNSNTEVEDLNTSIETPEINNENTTTDTENILNEDNNDMIDYPDNNTTTTDVIENEDSNSNIDYNLNNSSDITNDFETTNNLDLVDDSKNELEKEASVNNNTFLDSNNNYSSEDVTNKFIEDNNIESNDSNIDQNTTEVNNESISNIDTYQENTYANIINDDEDLINSEKIITNNDSNLYTNNNIDTNKNTNESYANNSITNYDSTINNTTTSNDNEVVSNKPNTPQMVDSSEIEYNYSNNLNYNGATTNSLINNTNTNNSIISQNNINTNDIGNNSYRYDEHGNLYNNTNGYNNNNINNINNKNNNVNTYEYNTLIDSINRGTIDNGINNL